MTAILSAIHPVPIIPTFMLCNFDWLLSANLQIIVVDNDIPVIIFPSIKKMDSFIIVSLLCTTFGVQIIYIGKVLCLE